MNKQLQDMLKTSAEADVAKAKLTLDLLGENRLALAPLNKDFYNNAEEALELLDSAYSRRHLNRFLEEEQ